MRDGQVKTRGREGQAHFVYPALTHIEIESFEDDNDFSGTLTRHCPSPTK